MYLSKLRIFGFKSFAQKVEVNFPKNGIISVVGPNGCGKSNIIDAIRWVLGEQKYKSLRSSKSEDVIFSGAENIPPMNMAEVSLLIENDQGVLGENQPQIMITRRVFRNGDSEYLINNKSCRLKDIQYLFYDTGMGAASYSLMESKMIDSILSDKDEERRLLFEEAAGISKYKKRRHETLRQLERTNSDLEKVQNNLRNSKRNISIFEKQAEKAKKWKTLKAQLTSLEMSYHLDLFNSEESQQKALAEKLKVKKLEEHHSQTATASLETKLQEKKLILLTDEKRLQEHNQLVFDIKQRAQQMEHSIERGKDRIQYLQQSLQKQTDRKTLGEQQIDSLQLQNEELLLKIQQDENQLKNLQDKNAVFQPKHQQFLENYQSQRAEFLSLSEKRLDILNTYSKAQQNLAGWVAQIEMLKNSKLELEKEALQFQEQLSSVTQVPLFDKKAAIEKQYQQKQMEFEEQRERLKLLVSNIAEHETEFSELEKAQTKLQTQYQTQSNLMKSQESGIRSYPYLLKNYEQDIKDTLYNQLQVQEEYIPFLEQALGESLQTLWIENSQKHQDLFNALMESENGRAFVFSPLNTGFKRTRFDPQVNGFSGWLIDKLLFPSQLESLLEYLIGHYGLIENTTEISVLISKSGTGDFWFLSKSGFQYHTSGLMKGGQVISDSWLKQKNALDNLLNQKQEAEGQYQSFNRVLVDFKKQKSQQNDGLNQLINQIEQLKSELSLVTRECDLFEIQQKSLQERQTESKVKLQNLEQKISVIENSFSPEQKILQESESAKESIENDYQKAQLELQQLEEQKSELEIQKNQLKSDIFGLETQITNTKQRSQFLNKSKTDQEAQQMKMGLEEKEWSVDLQESQEKISKWQQSINQLNLDLSEKTNQRDEVKKLYDSKMGVLNELQEKIQSQNKQLQQCVQKQHELELQIQKSQTTISNLQEKMYEAYEIHLQDCDGKFKKVSYQSELVVSEIAKLKNEFKNLGHFGTSAVEDYEQEKQRLAEVQEQYDDLRKAKNSLEKTIQKLDKVARQQFVETLDQIKKHFQEIFSSLFNGGQAKIEIEDIDPLDANIQINASPSGKKMRGVNLLSGGERALTAISLLFSLYLIKKSPYCIMDEIDGPLDDANISRFTNLLKTFNEKTQFIVVTHNKKTMVASDRLYGVTQEKKGISKLSSVNLEAK